ncbi:MAG TPA: C39 family peptidase, partial [Myxococcaceae bacterium]|nr:C39 family peptidase [Myxococcaceae bacterium]
FGGAQSPTASAAPAAPLAPARGIASGAPLGLSNTDQANQYMVDQLGGTAYNGDAGSTGTLDCGPASAVMALSRLGLVPPPTAATAESEILDQRYQMHGQGSASQDTTWDQEARGLQAAGATTKMIPETTQSIDAALARGSAVIIGGDPNRAWEGRLSAAGQYQESGDFGHFCTVLGKTADGHYVVNDPLSSAGSITVSAQELKDYLSYPSFHGAMEVSRG